MFEKAYGPEGQWVRLFRRDVARERVYVTMDEWESREAYEEFRERFAVGYAEIDTKCEGLTVSEANLGRSGTWLVQ